jgi:hypothetical protein
MGRYQVPMADTPPSEAGFLFWVTDPLSDHIDRTDHARRWAEAEKIASTYAPRAPIEPFNAGLLGLLFAGVILSVAGFGEMGGVQIIIALAVGYLAPWYWFKRQADAHTSAVVREALKLKRAAADSSSP